LEDAGALHDDDPAADPLHRLETSDARQHLIKALGHLPEKLRSVIVLRDIYDLSHEAIARQLGITESAAKVRLHRARHKLREQLFGADATPSDAGAVGAPDDPDDVEPNVVVLGPADARSLSDAARDVA
jgi:DNA-directed RNA polymerase specialized sigma24 family protein